MFERHIQDLIKHIPRDGSTVDLSELFFLLTIDSATEFLFGESINALSSGNADGFADSFNRSQVHIANNARFGMVINAIMTFFAKDSKWEHDRKFIHDFVDSFVQKGMAKRNQLLAEKASGEDSGRYVFIDELVRQTSDPIRIRSELLNILLAGRDTTASLLSNAWFVIAKRPDIWNKLQEEIAPLQGAAPTFEQIKDMKYLKAVLNESLRLHPVVPNNSRSALEDTTLPIGGGPDGKSPLFCPKGQVVAWSVYALHRRKDYYGEDAEEFRPERWLDNAETGKKGLRVGWEYLPFNGGARICLGQQFALTEASYTTVRLMQSFSKLESRDSEPWIEGLSLTCTSFNGTKVSLTPRH
ncbi:hypothetical protein AMS68_002698 [Peltaster fructicola]|uniref:Cytochrome P450 n=1 Tax=Peltaster fructicola TaxID=286661 RepID=A0A6H0XRA1_9PEZI|nr:hypothetical protein AMS68_002698 [Peltaster fructicola]